MIEPLTKRALALLRVLAGETVGKPWPEMQFRHRFSPSLRDKLATRGLIRSEKLHKHPRKRWLTITDRGRDALKEHDDA